MTAVAGARIEMQDGTTEARYCGHRHQRMPTNRNTNSHTLTHTYANARTHSTRRDRYHSPISFPQIHANTQNERTRERRRCAREMKAMRRWLPLCVVWRILGDFGAVSVMSRYPFLTQCEHVYTVIFVFTSASAPLCVCGVCLHVSAHAACTDAYVVFRVAHVMVFIHTEFRATHKKKCSNPFSKIERQANTHFHNMEMYLIRIITFCTHFPVSGDNDAVDFVKL